MAKEKLPTGFSRRPSGSLRVQIRLKGHEQVVKNFALVGDAPAERKRQLVEAEAWATETRRRLLAGAHVSSREAERTPLSEALRRYEAEGMSGSEENQKVDRYRIGIILRDPIAQRPIAFLNDKDVASFRDRLIRQGWRRKVDAAVRRLVKADAPKRRIEEVKALPRRRDEADAVRNPVDRRRIEAEIVEVELREAIKPPARTTVVNVIQLVSRSLDHVRQTMDGVAKTGGVKMPKASPGRERRPSPDEVKMMLARAGSIDPALPLLIEFAVQTTLRKGRVLTCRLSDIRDIGGGVQAIVFPRSSSVRNKRTGVVPVTKALRKIIDEACGLRQIEPAGDVDATIFDVTAAQIDAWWNKLLGDCGIGDLHWHDLRHEGTSRLFERGLSTAEVMSITGHSTQEMVDRYSHYSATIVHRKLEHGDDLSSLRSQLEFLIAQFSAAGGDVRDLLR